MYRIAVCEDESSLQEELVAQCREIVTGLGVEHEIMLFASAEELEAALSDGAQFDLLCLDILLAGKNGMELAMELRKRDEQTSILFITSSREYVLEGYKVNPSVICSSR
ncbi:MAG: response regulator [Eubacteriales bacterium]|nr:response regulator [Eubacteriales bacterium]